MNSFGRVLKMVGCRRWFKRKAKITVVASAYLPIGMFVIYIFLVFYIKIKFYHTQTSVEQKLSWKMDFSFLAQVLFAISQEKIFRAS